MVEKFVPLLTHFKMVDLVDMKIGRGFGQCLEIREMSGACGEHG